MEVYEISCNVLDTPTSQKVVSAGASVQSTALTAPSSNALVPTQSSIPCLITADAIGFIIQGINPVATNTGTCQIVLANSSYRIKLTSGNKIAYIPLVGAGNLYITPQG